MQKQIYILSLTLLTWACSEPALDTDTDGNAKTPEAQQYRAISTKADSASASSRDICTRYGLYDDGFCDEGCTQPDPDCAKGAPTSNGFDFLCVYEVREANGFCLSECGDLDPDCTDTAQEEQEDETRCSEDYNNNDGWCDSHCYPEDEDCIAQGDLCFSEYRYADRACDTDCAFPDPDCDYDAPDASKLEDWQRQVCGRLPLNDRTTSVQELATSICIERSPSQLPDCVAACVMVARGQ